LLEAEEVYQPFLKPLLDQPQSRYRFLADNGINPYVGHSHFKTGFFEKLLLRNRAERQETHTEVSLNPQTLVLARLSRLPKKIQAETVRRKTLTEPLIFNYVRRLIDGDGMHSLGRVRMLLWIPDHDKFTYMPRSICVRSNVSKLFDIVSNTSEIAGSSDPPTFRRRAKYEILSALDTARRMNQSGISMRRDRRSKLHKEALIAVNATEQSRKDADVVVPRETVTQRSYNLAEELSEMEALERDFYVGGHFKRHKSNEDITSNDKRKKEMTPEYLRMVELQEKLASLTMAPTLLPHPALSTGAILLEDLYQLECDVQNTPSLDPTLQIKKEAMEALVMRITRLQERFRTRHVIDLAQLDDNAMAFRRVPPPAQWDRRQCEPLIVHENEFFPRLKMALLDIVPKDASDIQERAAIFRMPLARALRPLGTHTIERALEEVAHGSAEALVPNCPALRNPLKGGRMHPENLRVHMLTDEMLQELLDAWNRWPFKKSDEQVLTSLNRPSLYHHLENDDVD